MKNNHLRKAAIASLGLAFLSTSSAFAATLTWDDGDETGFWNTTDLNWSGTDPWDNTTPDDAIFDAAGVGTVTLTEAIAAGSVTFNTAGYTITGETITLSGGATALTSNATSTINSNVTITTTAGTITSTSGTLTLGGTLDAGSLALTFDGAGNTTLSNGIANAVSLTKIGTGTLFLGGSNSYSGATTLSGGILQAGSATGFSANSSISLASGTRLVLGGFSNTVGGLNGTGGVVENANATAATLTISNSGTNSYSSNLQNGTGAGALAVIKTGAGAQAITNATFTGGLTINQGTWQLGGVNGLGNGTVTINGGALSSNSTTARTLTNIANTLAISGSFTLGDLTNTGALTLPGAVTLSSNPTITVPTGNSHIFSGNIGGSSSFTKDGAGTLTLSGTNDYSGNTALSAGTLVLNNNSALSSGELNITGTSAITAINGIATANKINVGANTLTLRLTNAGAATSTFSGQLTGAGIINIGGSGSGNNTTILDFTNSNNTFTGNIVGASGNVNGADYFRFATIGDGGNFTFQKAGNRGGVIYNGASAVTFGTRQIAIGAGFGGGGVYGVNGNGVAQNSFENNASNAAHTVSFNSNLSVGAIASTSVFYFGGSNAGNNTFAGTIADAASTNTLGIGKIGAGKWILTGSNSFQGNTFIQQGTLSVNTIDVAANNQALGKGSLILFGYAGNSGTLEYTGSANAETDKQIVVGNLNNNNHGGGGGIVNNSVTGTLTFNNSIFNAISVPSLTFNITTVDRTLTLGGSNTGANTISGKIQDNVAGAAQVLLTKTGTGRWVLEGDNTYTGTTAIQGGVLVAGHVNAIAGGLAHGGSGAVISLTGSGILGLGAGDFTRLPSGASLTAGRIAFLDNGGFAAYGADRIVNFGGAGGIVAIGSTATSVIGNLNGKTLILGHATATHKVTVTNTLDFGGGSRTIQVDDGLAEIDAEISGVLQPQAAGTAGLTKAGFGTLLLTNANTLNDNVNVLSGTLLVNNTTGSGTGTGTVRVSGGSFAGPIAKLGGTGSIGGSVVLLDEWAFGMKNGGVLAPTAAASGTALDVIGTTTFAGGSIFEWNMIADDPAADPGINAANSGSYSQLVGTDTIGGGGAVFSIVLGAGNTFADAFWDTNKTWTNVFSGSGAINNLADIFSSFGGTGVSTAGVVTGRGSFSFTSTSTLNWTAIPEPTTALGGLLLTAGLLRRRRKDEV